MTRSATPAGTLVVGSEGLAKAVQRDRELTGWLAVARADDLRVITSAATLVEVVHPRLKRPALERTLSRIVVEPVTEEIARRLPLSWGRRAARAPAGDRRHPLGHRAGQSWTGDDPDLGPRGSADVVWSGATIIKI